jgi:hypothetical protein
MLIESKDVAHFKTEVCNENALIAAILKRDFVASMPEIILDVGAGLGDLAAAAFPDKRAILLDPLDYAPGTDSNVHNRLVGDFFTFADSVNLKTVFFCHSLQFLDSDPQKLKSRLLSLAPAKVVTVTNTNRDLLGRLIKQLRGAGYSFNAEEDVPDFPPRPYRLAKHRVFAATMKAGSFRELAGAVAYLLDAPADPQLILACEGLLRDDLHTPIMTIEQTIRLFQDE